MSENSDHSFTIVELPRPKKGAPATATGAGGGAVPDAARPMLVYAMVVGYECVQGNNRFTLFGIEAGTDTGDTYVFLIKLIMCLEKSKSKLLQSRSRYPCSHARTAISLHPFVHSICSRNIL